MTVMYNVYKFRFQTLIEKIFNNDLMPNLYLMIYIRNLLLNVKPIKMKRRQIFGMTHGRNPEIVC